MIAPASRRWDRETLLLGYLAALVSVISFLFYFRRGGILLYGDAVAHINIARRVFDSRTPGLLQLGTVWLPLPHLLTIPFLLSDSAWRSGIGGSIPSLVAYVGGAMGIFRLVRGWLSSHAQVDGAGRFSAWLAAAIYVANPNLIYLQTTAMSEALYLALFIWTVVFFSEFVQARTRSDGESESAGSRSLVKCGLCVAAAELTRYDGWSVAALLGIVVLIAAARSGRMNFRGGKPRLRQNTRNFLLMISSVPGLWLLYNGTVYRNPFEFENGPYSARAIENKTARRGYPPHPGAHNLMAATQYFVKSGEFNLAEEKWQKAWVGLAFLGSALILLLDLRLAPLLLLWTPIPFYVLSIAYGGVPLFVPSWWPFSYYNVRYGIQLLPAAAVFLSLAAYFLASLFPPRAFKVAIGAFALLFVSASYSSVWHARPVCFQEAWVNSRTRLALESELALNVRHLPPNSTLLMYLGDHVGALQDAGIPLKRVINEGNHRVWKQPSDEEGLWERALADPRNFVDYAIGFDGDPVVQSARQHQLPTLAIIETAGQPPAMIYGAKGNLGR